jgi:hypothetical protein
MAASPIRTPHGRCGSSSGYEGGDVITDIFNRANVFLRENLTQFFPGGAQADTPAILHVSMKFSESESEPQVHIDLAQFGTNVSAPDRRSWRLPFSATGAPSWLSHDSEMSLELPLQIVDGVRAALAEMNIAAQQPLWLDLMRPYGYLGILPWEQTLSVALDRAVLRLPDFLLPPRETTDVLVAALLFDPPLETPAEKAVAQAKQMAETILKNSLRLQTNVHIFPSSGWAERLRGETFSDGIRLHDPAGADTTGKSARENNAPAFSSLSPWINWISRAVEGRSIDVVHFVCACETRGPSAALTLSSSPSPEERIVILAPADIHDLGAMLTRLGAWAAMFSPPADKTRAPVMAFLADGFSHSRPGPALYHPFATPEDVAAVGEAYRFVFATSSGQAPRLKNGFLYCYPSAVADTADVGSQALTKAAGAALELIQQRAPLVDRVLTTVTNALPGVPNYVIKNAPNWAGAAQRYVETTALSQMRRASSDVLFSQPERKPDDERSSSATAALSATHEALADVQNVVREYLNKTWKA